MSKRIVAIILAVVIVFGGLLVSIGSFMIGSFMNADKSKETLMEPTPTVVKSGNTQKQIAKLNLNGEIMDSAAPSAFGGGNTYNHKAFMSYLKAIEKDKSIKGVLINVNTPGGATYPTDEIHEEILKLKAKGKKVYVNMKSMAASGGYYISAPADKIYAGPQTLTGSIGVIMHGMDYSGLQKKLGVKSNTIKSGEHKDILSSSRPMSDEEKDIMQSVIDDSFDRFVDVVKEGRNMPEKKVRKLADGRIYSAQQAEKNGLIDEIALEDKIIKDLKKEVKSKNAQVVSFEESDKGLGSLFGLDATFDSIKATFNDVRSILKNDTKTQPMYLYEG
ncbi:signal peptide peptidase SppA [Staphylococcus massiliensis]|uniref:signal peptide peptidase SppA n=1 Tax=Staphylococcus massiliensis TaxID=555791 RepID=UPI001EDE13F3|nr:signal peptide peptidase SppA [Staphylococcus massiliensis]MCG3400857.1 signal peptide peptidase SppA [Staphylococcus massiliensis]